MNYTKAPNLQPAPRSNWLKKVDEFILANIDNNKLTVTDVAYAVFISERQFYRKIKKLSGKTPNQYLQDIRLKKARKFLESGTFSTVKEVALSVGYSRSDYFSRLYESHYGVRPVGYFQLSLNLRNK